MESSDPLVRAATELLILRGWPAELIVLNKNYYLQCTLYQDLDQSLQWFVVVLIPAKLNPNYLGPSNSYYYAVIVMASLSLCICLLSGVLIAVYRNCRIIQLAKPEYIIAVVIGCSGLSVFTLISLGPNNHLNCALRPYVFNLSFSLAFTPLIVKCVRAYFTFVRSWHVTALLVQTNEKQLSSSHLLLGSLLFLAIDAAILSVSLYGPGRGRRGTEPYQSSVVGPDGAHYELTYCGYHHNDGLFYSQLAYKGILIALSCVMSVLTRRVADAIVGTQALVAIVYNCLFVGVVVVYVTKSYSDVPAIVLTQAAGIGFCVCTTCLVLVVPPIYRIWASGDKAAAAGVIEEMLNARRSPPLDVITPVVIEDRPSGEIRQKKKKPKNAAAASLCLGDSHRLNRLALNPNGNLAESKDSFVFFPTLRKQWKNRIRQVG